ncbi:MAG TPA: hypothetical protein VIW68_03220 [Candidatus Sulfotelmatobacter sp.]
MSLSSDPLGFPWYSKHCFAILMGSFVLWAAYSGEPWHGRNNEPYPNQPFFRACAAILGVAMIGLSLWGLWLDRR